MAQQPLDRLNRDVLARGIHVRRGTSEDEFATFEVMRRAMNYEMQWTQHAETRHHVRLAASRDGKLQAVSHEGWEVTSRPSHYNVAGTKTTARLYASPNVWTRVNVVHADRNTPGFMRATTLR